MGVGVGVGVRFSVDGQTCQACQAKSLLGWKRTAVAERVAGILRFAPQSSPRQPGIGFASRRRQHACWRSVHTQYSEVLINQYIHAYTHTHTHPRPGMEFAVPLQSPAHIRKMRHRELSSISLSCRFPRERLQSTFCCPTAAVPPP
jgi:hypothetical protein